ncbi:DNA polymerase [Saccharopolyspora indica]|uniref:DNA polymerase n=1 Tax=Saccharopolyspora indica TaxID=1229659 RepID=UPI0022EAA00A|nr:DNA polymerase [Saccharopolyspora indica]MDA3643823.1 DNA polymerase [Saccharopolyspora indica]
MKPTGTLVFDIETHSAEYLHTMAPETFVRLIGYKWVGQPEIALTADLEEIREQIQRARWIIGHNIHAFDLPAVFGTKSDFPMELADQGRVYDTWTHAVLVHPAPFQYVNRFGKTALAKGPGEMKKWFSLDEQAHQLGVKGKTHDLKALAAEFGGFGEIPIDDPRYRDYLRGDVEASEAVARALLKKGPLDPYAMRRQRVSSRAAVISSNGLRLDIERATRRRDQLAARRDVVLGELSAKYDLPTDSDSPWSTDKGKKAILAALADHGITPGTVDWPKTPGWQNRDKKLAEAEDKIEELEAKIRLWESEIRAGELRTVSLKARQRWVFAAEDKIRELRENPLPTAFGLSLSGETLIELTKGTAAEELGRALAELKGQRSLAQLALDSVHEDGFVHPEITNLQRSGRWSTTKPGLTVWTSRGEGAAEKSYFIPDSEDDLLLEIDYSNADARIVAALSGDAKYAERFEPGADGHTINAIAAWGEEAVAAEPEKYRQMAKPLGHGWSYGGRAKGLSRASGLPLETSETFVNGMDAQFKVLISWQNRVREFARKNGYVQNEWGGKLWVEKGREFTQSPALLGQNGTTEIVCDALLAMPYHVIRRVKAQIHDAILFSVPKKNWEACRDYLFEIMGTKFKPAIGGQEIEFPVDAKPAGETWQEANHA